MTYNEKNKNRVQVDEYLKDRRKKTLYERVEDVESEVGGVWAYLREGFKEELWAELEKEYFSRKHNSLFKRIKDKWTSLDLLESLKRSISSLTNK